MKLEEVLLSVADALLYPVLGLALLALAGVLVEAGGFVVELLRRRRRSFVNLEAQSSEAAAALRRGDPAYARTRLAGLATNAAMGEVLGFLVTIWGHPSAGDHAAKALADYELRGMKRLERTRVLVRAGPALGLMGTLIPLSPALAALGEGNVRELSEGLRVAFGVTVIGILIGMIAFGISLVRERLYAQDHSDLEYVAALLGEAEVPTHATAVAAAG